MRGHLSTIYELPLINILGVGRSLKLAEAHGHVAAGARLVAFQNILEFDNFFLGEDVAHARHRNNRGMTKKVKQFEEVVQPVHALFHLE